MTDLTAFERQLSGEAAGLMGPVLPVDDLAIYEAVTASSRQKGWGFRMFSALKFVAASAIVAMFGGFLLAGVLSGPPDREVPPAGVSDSPLPAFPTGTFRAVEEDVTLELRADGTCLRSGVPCTFGVSADVYSEMTFEDPTGAQVPATYHWAFDGEHLSFEPWGVDPRPNRRALYTDHTFRLVEAGEPLALSLGSDFPIGMLTEAESRTTPRLFFREDGRYEAQRYEGSTGDYVVNGDYYTEMTGDWEGPAGKVPATYRWSWDGQRLTFSPWGEDANGYRRAIYTDYAYVMEPNATGGKRRLLLSDPRLDFWVTVEVGERDDGRYVADATIDDEPLGAGIGDTPKEAVEAALQPLGEPYASDLADNV